VTTELRDLARDIALEAADLAKRRRAEGVSVAASKSTPVDIVTEADRETEQLIRDRIAAARPGDGILGEEGGVAAGTSGITWVVDPIDGTVNYLYGIPHYAVSIAVVEGEPDPRTWNALAAAVVNPATGETFTATAGGGADLNGAPIRVSDPVPLSQALVGTGFAYRAETRAEQGAVVARLLPEVRDIRRLGTASLDLCGVATGRLDAYYERTLSPWDHAAGVLIAAEAGAAVRGRDGAPDRDFTLAAHPEVADALEARLVAHGLFDFAI
jgi:myo-inositol-1(or 4)-monophosphatase